MGSRFLKKNCKSLKPEPLNLRPLEEAEEEDNVDLLLNRRREIVKVSLTGLGDIEGKEDIAVLDRVNKFLLTPEKAPVNTSQKSLTFDSEICTQRENGRNNLNKSQINVSVKGVKDQTPKDSFRAKKPGKAESTKNDQGKQEKDGNPEDRSKGFYPSLGHCPHRIIYVKEAFDRLDTLHMAPTLVVKFTEDADHFKEHHNIDAFNWRRDVIPVCVSDDENSEVFDFHVTAGSNKLSQWGYKLVDPSRLMGCSPVSDSTSSSSDSSQVCFSGEEDSIPHTKDFDRMLNKNGRILSAPHY
ncbi:uncharacterized protein LOC134275729 isoform X2 [Saccostrea cucullata]|uniref:uncharacterized protein LOC134275729 isoform X2 n=1 Tax=Saccostrea cuccullata TaxID=36930 RepID=UPI002ED515E4